MPDQIQEIKDKLDIVKVVGSYIKLKKSGANYRAICPFHSEKKPSLFVSPARQIWKCFGCGASGDIFGFVKQIEGVEFGDALRILAKRAGVELKKQDPKLRTKRQRLYEVCEIGCQFFEKQLKSSSTGKKARKYLLDRGIKEESIKKWRLGYSPDTWSELSDFLVGKGYQRSEVIKAGLAVKSSKSKGSYDRFRGRIIFPIFDLHSQVVGFGGRVFGKEKEEKEIAKYINIPQTPLYNKSKILYGLNQAKVSIRKKNQCILAEGYTDVIMSHQAGFDNTVATSGTSLTSSHLNILKRYSDNLLLAFDMDVAGNTATKRGIDMAQRKGFGIKVIRMPEDNDPADIVSENPKKWGQIIEKAKSIVGFYFDSAFSKFSKKTAEGKKKIGEMVLPAIKRIPNQIERAHWIQELSNRLGIPEEDVFEQFKLTNKTSSSSSRPEVIEPDQQETSTQSSRISKTRKEILEERALSLLFACPEHFELLEDDHFPCFSEKSSQLLKQVCSCVSKTQKKEKKEKALNQTLEKIKKEENEEFKELIDTLCLKGEVDMEGEMEPTTEIKFCLNELKSINIKKRLKKISEEIKEAEQNQNEQEITDLIKKFKKFSQKLREI